ncbi:hypothetical protein LCGC14_2694770 [marine sediment metagenome]|uniref:Uncharacterized protein n=1 Tax=marine sediment metagenome TaxID=412755 RepID=A0A0F8ZHJ0_9ZZZZ
MKTNYNSIHRKFNNWAWGSSIHEMDGNLCSYFWGTILAIVMSPFIALGKIVGFIIDHIHIDIEIPTISYDTTRKIYSAIGHTCLAGSLIGYILLVIYLGFPVLFFTGVVIGTIGGCILMIFGMGAIVDKYREAHPKKRKEKGPNMFLEWTKAKKNKKVF